MATILDIAKSCQSTEKSKKITATRHLMRRCRIYSYLESYFSRASAIAAAARRPSPIARITVAPPRTMSPPA